MQRIICFVFVLISTAGVVCGQDPGPQPPIILEYADSLKGFGQVDEGTREFIGNVKFKQGNVTVTCDRAVHEIVLNRARLYGNVVVTQGTMTLKAPYLTYDGNTYIATTDRGVTVIDEGRVLTAKRGSYSTKSQIAVFNDSVVAVDDTTTIWSDRAVYNRDSKVSTAAGRVVVHDTIESAWLRTDSLFHDPNSDIIKMIGNAAVWQCKEKDTLFIIADSINVYKAPSERYIAKGNVELVQGSVAARADSVDYNASWGMINLNIEPVIWSDSMQLLADTITVLAPYRELENITGSRRAIMVSRSDTLRPTRYDQISGDTIILIVAQDTVRKLVSFSDAKSITWRLEADEPQGMTQFASDTIKAYFVDGKPEDIYWLGGIQGQHNPENIASQHVSEYLLPGFAWRTDRPIKLGTPLPFTEAPYRAKSQSRSAQDESIPGK